MRSDRRYEYGDLDERDDGWREPRGLGAWGESDHALRDRDRERDAWYRSRDIDPRDLGERDFERSAYRDPIRGAADRVGMRMDESAMHMGQGMQRMGRDMEYAADRFGDRMGERAYRMGDEVQRVGDRIADRMGEGAYRMNEGMQRATERVGDRMIEGSMRMRGGAERIAEGAERTGDRAHRVRERMRNTFYRLRGPFVGRGPKGYRIIDERIREEVCEQIAHQGWIDASDVEVKVEHGEVRLRGTVRARADKRGLECLIEQIPGVEDVHNELTFRRGEPAQLPPGAPPASARGRSR